MMEETFISDFSSDLTPFPEGPIVNSTRRSATNGPERLTPVTSRSSLKNEKGESPKPAVRNLMLKKIDDLLHKPKKPKGQSVLSHEAFKHASSDPGPFIQSRVPRQSSSDDYLMLYGQNRAQRDAEGEPDIAAMLENPKLSGFVIPWITTIDPEVPFVVEQPLPGTESRVLSKSKEIAIPNSSNATNTNTTTTPNVADRHDPGSWSRYSSDGRSGSYLDYHIEEHHETKRIGGATKSTITSSIPVFYKNSLNHHNLALHSNDTDSEDNSTRRKLEFFQYCNPHAIDSMNLMSTPSLTSLELEFKHHHQRNAGKSKRRPPSTLMSSDPGSQLPSKPANPLAKTSSQRLSSHESEMLFLEYEQKLRDMEKEMERKRRDLELELEQKLNALTADPASQQLVSTVSTISINAPTAQTKNS